jgi:hypothetical protein
MTQLFLRSRDNYTVLTVSLCPYRSSNVCQVHQLRKQRFLRFWVSAAPLLSVQYFCDVTLCCWVSGYWHCTGLYCLHVQGLNSPTRSLSSPVDRFNMKTVQSFEMSATSNPATQCHIPEALNAQCDSCWHRYTWSTDTNKCIKTSLSLISSLKVFPGTHFDTSLLPSSGGSLMFVHRPMFLSYIRTVVSIFVITTLYKIV